VVLSVWPITEKELASVAALVSVNVSDVKLTSFAAGPYFSVCVKVAT